MGSYRGMNLGDEVVLWPSERLFIGREEECQALRDWLAQKLAPTFVIGLHGIGGIGKSTLLLRFFQIARDAGALTAWLDARTVDNTAQSFLSALPSVFHSTTLASQLTAQHAVLAIDNYDEIYGLDAWLREVLLPSWPSHNLLVVLASRQSILSRWRLDPGWQRRAIDLPLKPFTLAEIRQWQANVSRTPTQEIPAETLYEQTRGLPLALALSLETPSIPDTTGLPALWNDLDEHSPSRDAIDILALTLVAPWNFIQEILHRPVSLAEYQSLSQLAFVRRTPQGLTLHDLVRHYWYEHLRTKRPEHFTQLRDKIFRRFVHDCRVGTPTSGTFMSQQFFWLFRDVFGITTPYANLRALLDQFEPTPFRREDTEWLLNVSRLWQRESLPVSAEDAQGFLYEVMTRFPELLRILRRQDTGRPVAYMMSIWLTPATADLMRAYHPAFTDALLDALHLSQENLGQSNTTYHLTAGVDPTQHDYPRDELMGIVIRDAFGLMAGNRNLVMAQVPALQQFLQTFGYHATTFHSGDAILYELDLRQLPFARWIVPVLARLSHSALIRRTDITSAEVKAAYEHLHDHSFHLADDSVFSADAGPIWRRGLKDLLEPPFIAPLTAQDAQVLHWVYVERHTDPISAMKRFAFSRASFYRHLRSALEHVTEVVQKTF
ncbi:hypothetical protein CO251_02685 [Sulfobacillus sp. hq2]|nr:hypothetical protein CO251_02685 [Sulfobacillus sp. hq2]